MNRFHEVLRDTLPHLRRYAVLVALSTAEGDRLVAALLRSLVDAPVDATPMPIRVGLFRRLHDGWGALLVGDDQHAAGSTPYPGTLRGRLDRLTVPERQAILLSTLERFSVDQVAFVLSRGHDETAALLDRARHRLAALMTPVLIVEDDEIIALGLRDAVERLGFVVCGVAGDRRAALDAARQAPPRIVLADIKLRAGDDEGLWVAQQIRALHGSSVVYVTGHPERVPANDIGEMSIVLDKPIDPAKLGTALRRLIA